MSAKSPSRLKEFPIAWFAMVMGLAGYTIAWNRATIAFGLSFAPGHYLLPAVGALFALALAVFAVKTVRYPRETLAEIRHPVKLAFVPTISISLLLLAIAAMHQAPALSKGLWVAGTVLHAGLTLYVMSSWIRHDKFEITHLNPAWFIPVVGNILVPIAGVRHASPEISWIFFGFGLFFWPVLTAIIFYRLIFHGSLPERFMPTLFIFIAPPAVGFLSYLNLAGGLDAFARVLYGTALFFTALMLAQAPQLVRLRFFLSWWAYSFPLAAVTIATLVMAHETGARGYLWLGGALLGLLSLVVVMLLVRTGLAVARREICVEGP
ncbi:MAG: SLAC1 anion channel family protein [bacterium]|nr:SLAC1 anion channel family protein [bacterium]